MLLLFLLFTSLSIYVLLAIVTSRNLTSIPPRRNNWQPNVSVVVACKNEDENLGDLFHSLSHLDYPAEKLEIIIIDDASTDQSAHLIRQFRAENPGLIHVALADGEKEKPGKAGALLAGIEKSRGEVLFITDADCRIPPGWIVSLLSAFQANIGVVGGFTLIDRPRSLFERLQALDWQFLLSVAAAAAHMGRPITWVGNNLAIRRTAYDEVGGYRNVRNSLVEDFALIDAIERGGKWSCRFYAMPQGVVKTRAAASIRQLYHQRKRWAAGISGARPFSWLFMGAAFLTHIFIVAAPIACPPCAVAALLLKIWSDRRILSKSAALLQEKTSLKELALFQPYYIAYSILLPFLLILDRRVVWKDQVF